MDILLTFRTTFYNKRGEEVFDSKQIAIDYLTSIRFYFDFLSCIPWDLMVETQAEKDALRITGILKLIRITRIAEILQKVELRDDKKALIQIF